MRDPEEISALLDERRTDMAGVMSKRTEVRDCLNGDLRVSLPQIDKYEKPFTPNILVKAVDGNAQRISSTMPDPRFTPVKSTKQGQTAAIDKRKAVLGWWDNSSLDSKMPRRARHYVSYGSTPVAIVPDLSASAPVWQLRDPLGCYPGERANPDDVYVEDVIFTYKRTNRWLKAHYGFIPQGIEKSKPSDKFDVVEYSDADSTVIFVQHNSDNPGSNYMTAAATQGRRLTPLEVIEHGYGCCPVTVLNRSTVDRPLGQFDEQVGQFMMMARLFALEVWGVQTDMFPNVWLLGQNGQNPTLTRPADGLRGEIGEVRNGTIFVENKQINYQASLLRNDLERAMRVGGGIPSQMGGENPTNVRTGRASDTVLSAAIDFPIAEAQRDLARALEAENRIAIKVAKRWFGAKQVSFYVPALKSKVDFTANDLFDSDQHEVKYALAGTDVNNLVITGGQRVGMGTLSKRSFMEIDPYVDDPEAEHDRIIAEGIEMAVLGAFQQQTAAGTIPAVDAARVMELVVGNKVELAEAITKAQQEAQERQAAAPQTPADAQPGLSQPGMGAEMGGPIPEPAEGPARLNSLLMNLRGPQQASRAERVTV